MPHPVVDLISALHTLMMVLPALLNRAHQPPLGAVLTPFLQLLLLLQLQVLSLRLGLSLLLLGVVGSDGFDQ